MKFNDIINELLGEELSREDRIKALKSIPSTVQYRVMDLAMSRGETDVISDELKEGTDIESVATSAKESYIDSIRVDFENDEEDGEDELQKFVNDWVYGPVVSDDRTVAGVYTGEESMIIVLSQNSKFFGYTEDDLQDNWEEINDCLNWD
jgi:hypothetical protein